MSTVERFRLQGRRALVTGASSGLGRHFALTLAQAGATVIVAARSIDKLAETVTEIKAAGGDASAVRLDVTDVASVQGAFDEIGAGGVADVIVNNAGLAVSRPLLEQTESDWDTVLDTNLKGAWLVAQEAARRLVAAKRPGSIVNIASITGERVAGGVAPYCTSKAGVIHLTRAMALELARHEGSLRNQGLHRARRARWPHWHVCRRQGPKGPRTQHRQVAHREEEFMMLRAGSAGS